MPQAYAEGVRVDLPWGDKKMEEGVWAEKLEGYSKKDVKNTVPAGVQVPISIHEPAAPSLELNEHSRRR